MGWRGATSSIGNGHSAPCPRAWHWDMDLLAEAVRAWEAGRQEVHEEPRWEADDVQVIALDALHQGRAQALDRIAARPVLPLAAAHVVRQVARCQRPEGDPR